MIDKDCNVHKEFPKDLQKPMEALVDAFLYLGPQDLQLAEQMPADIALDVDYRMEVHRRESLQGFPGAASGAGPGALKEEDQQIVDGAEHPIFVIPKMPDDPKLDREIVQSCLEHKNANTKAQ